jgi:hypothetical protein
MPAWLIWVIAAGVLAGAETLSMDFVLVMCAGGAAAGAVTAAAGAPPAIQVLVARVRRDRVAGLCPAPSRAATWPAKVRNSWAPRR